MADIITELAEWRQAASCEAGLRREFKALADRYREALQSIAANGCCDRCQEAALVARKALRDDQ